MTTFWMFLLRWEFRGLIIQGHNNFGKFLWICCSTGIIHYSLVLLGSDEVMRKISAFDNEHGLIGESKSDLNTHTLQWLSLLFTIIAILPLYQFVFLQIMLVLSNSDTILECITSGWCVQEKKRLMFRAFRAWPCSAAGVNCNIIRSLRQPENSRLLYRAEGSHG